MVIPEGSRGGSVICIQDRHLPERAIRSIWHAQADGATEEWRRILTTSVLRVAIKSMLPAILFSGFWGSYSQMSIRDSTSTVLVMADMKSSRPSSTTWPKQLRDWILWVSRDHGKSDGAAYLSLRSEGHLWMTLHLVSLRATSSEAVSLFVALSLVMCPS